MSKQSKAKEAQGFTKQLNCCAICKHFTYESETINSQWSNNTLVIKRNLRCSLGGFKCGQMTTCRMFEPKEQQ